MCGGKALKVRSTVRNGTNAKRVVAVVIEQLQNRLRYGRSPAMQTKHDDESERGEGQRSLATFLRTVYPDRKKEHLLTAGGSAV